MRWEVLESLSKTHVICQDTAPRELRSFVDGTKSVMKDRDILVRSDIKVDPGFSGPKLTNLITFR
jgi:hypothetical protein